MITATEQRDGLAKIIDSIVDDSVTVHRSAWNGITAFPCVVIGMPQWQPEQRTNWCNMRTTWPIGVVVNRPGTDDAGTVDTLDKTWQQLLSGLLDVSAADPGLGGICAQNVITRSTFGLFRIADVDYPAQTIFIDLYG